MTNKDLLKLFLSVIEFHDFDLEQSIVFCFYKDTIINQDYLLYLLSKIEADFYNFNVYLDFSKDYEKIIDDIITDICDIIDIIEEYDEEDIDLEELKNKIKDISKDVSKIIEYVKKWIKNEK